MALFEHIAYFSELDGCMTMRPGADGTTLRYFVDPEQNCEGLIDHVKHTYVTGKKKVFKVAGKNEHNILARHLPLLRFATRVCVADMLTRVEETADPSVLVVHEGDNLHADAPFSQALKLLASECCLRKIPMTVLMCKAHSDNGFSAAFYEPWTTMFRELPYAEDERHLMRVYFAVLKESAEDVKASGTFELATHTYFVGSEWYKFRADGATPTSGYSQLQEHRNSDAHEETHIAPGASLFTRHPCGHEAKRRRKE